MKANVVFAVVCVLVLSVSGCATYKPQMVRIESIDSYYNKTTVSGVTIAVDPYDVESKAKSAFYVDVTKKDIKPIQIVVDNLSDDNILLVRSQVRLTDRSGNEYQPVNSKYVYNLFEKSELAYAFWGFGIFSYMSAEKANEKMQSDWYEKEFPEERTIVSQRKASGFIFFETGQHLKGSIVKIDVLNLRTNKYSTFEIPI